MRTFLVIAVIIILLIVGKVYIFKKPEEKGGGGFGGGAPSSKSDKKGEKGKDGKKGEGMPTMVSVYVTKFENIDNTVFSSGTISPNEEVELRTEVSGRLIDLNLKEGSNVSKGQLIAKLKDDDLRAQLKKLEFEEALAKQIEARQKKLLEINAISKEEYEISANKINTLNADKELIRVNISKTSLRAPFSGKIGLKSISEGAYVTPATTIAILTQTNPVKIDFTIPEKYSTQLKVGRKVKFEVDGQQGDFEANITAIDPKVDANLRTLKLRATAKNSSGNLVPGMFVRVSLDLNAQNSIMIPTESVVPVLKGKKVFVVKEGKATEVMIQTGLRTDQKIQVTEGLSEGDSLIITGIMSIKKDAPVKVKPTKLS